MAICYHNVKIVGPRARPGLIYITFIAVNVLR